MTSGNLKLHDHQSVGLILSHLEVHPVQTLVLLVELGVHVLRHGLQVGEDPSHRLQVLLHLVLSGVVVDPVDHGAVRLHGAAAVAPAGLLRHCPAALAAAAGPLCVTFPLRVCVSYPPVPKGDMFVSLRFTQFKKLTIPNIPLQWIRSNTYYKFPESNASYLFHGQTQRPHHFSIPVMCFSASFISALILSMSPSTLANCSVVFRGGEGLCERRKRRRK